MRTATCENCINFKPTYFNCGECRRNAPVVAELIVTVNPAGPREHKPSWPTVQYQDWCGEWAMKQPEVAK